jgi:two-component system OmpR family sensor kinase
MASLRTRVLLSVLVLSAVGLTVLGVVTYAEQRSFLLGRVDQEAMQAGPAISRALDEAGYVPAGASRAQQGSPAGSGGSEGAAPAGRGGGLDGGRDGGPGGAPGGGPPNIN